MTDAIDWMSEAIRNRSIIRSQEILKEKGDCLTFDALLAEIYHQALIDLKNTDIAIMPPNYNLSDVIINRKKASKSDSEREK